MLISLLSLRRKDTEMCYFRITEISENPPKYHLFVYFRVFLPCEKKGFCAVLLVSVLGSAVFKSLSGSPFDFPELISFLI